MTEDLFLHDNRTFQNDKVSEATKNCLEPHSPNKHHILHLIIQSLAAKFDKLSILFF